jgi:methylenetetrahydrofolate dehydrogenase (NADP+)/methenyltetrahydrofolate cyclohydrolase
MLLYGKPVAEKLRAEQTARIVAGGVTPRLAIIQAGKNLASTSYIKMKQRYGESIGAAVDHHIYSGEAAVLKPAIERLNADSQVHGIIVQLPLPDPSATDSVLAAIDPAKDIDGLTDRGHFKSATAMAVLQLLKYYEIPLKEQPIAMVGHGRLVGAPLTALLKELGAKVTVCDINTADLGAATHGANVIISATGVAGLIKPDMVHDGAVVVDVGTAEEAGSIVGDADPGLLDNDTLKLTPAKGGVGPVTVSMLFEQLLTAAGL